MIWTLPLLAALTIGSPEPKLQNSAGDEAKLKEGAEIYDLFCVACHMENGNAQLQRLRLADGVWRHGGSLEEIQKTISEGVDATQMQPFKDILKKDEIEAVALYVKSLAAEAEKKSKP